MAPHETSATVSDSPVTATDFEELQQSVLWTEADAAALHRAADILGPQTEAILDVWYGFVGSHAHLVKEFAGADGQPDAAYLAGVRERFGQWIVDLCRSDHGADWLAYQEEIGLRHTSKKNVTDGVNSPSTHVPIRHLIALIVPITVTIRPFLERGESDARQVEAMYQAWFKAVVQSVALWARPYCPTVW